MKQIRCLVVDDEPYARSKMIKLLADEADIELVGECGNGLETLEAIKTLQPDLVFLDIQMPDLDGLGVVRALPPDNRPQLVFVTAYDSYAVTAFELRALDYLLKPYDRKRLSETLKRVRQARQNHPDSDRYGEILEMLAALRGTGPQESGSSLASKPAQAEQQPQYWDRFIIKKGDRVRFIKVDEVCWIKAAGKRVELHGRTQDNQPPPVTLFKKGLSEVVSHLDPARFRRIHRSIVVNLECIAEIQNWFWGEYVILLHDGTKLMSGRAFKEQVGALLRQ